MLLVSFGTATGLFAKSNPPIETPSGTKPAEPAGPGQNPAKPAEPGNAAKPNNTNNPANPNTPAEPSKPADSLTKGNPAEETPSGTKPADPANPGENPANPAEPGDKKIPEPEKNVDEKDKPDTEDKDAKDKDSKDAKDKKDKPGKEPKDKKDKSGKGGESGGGKGVSLPSGISTPQGGAAIGAVGGGILGAVLSGGKKEEKKEEPKAAPKETENAVSVSSATKEAEPVEVSTKAVVAEPLFSEGVGPRIAVIPFDGESGAEFAATLAGALSPNFKVYNPEALAAKAYASAAINRVTARKTAAELGVEYLVTGKVSKKSETLSIISIFLRDAKTGDIRLTDNQNIRAGEDKGSAVVSFAFKIAERLAH